MLSAKGANGASINKAKAMDKNPPKKHLANNFLGSCTLSFRLIRYRKIMTGVMEAMSRLIG